MSGRDKRRFPRKQFAHTVRVTDRLGRTPQVIAFQAQDLSAGGLFVESDLLLELDEEVRLEIPLDADALTARGRVARVAHADGRRGMGIAFLAMAPGARDRLHRFLDGV